MGLVGGSTVTEDDTGTWGTAVVGCVLVLGLLPFGLVLLVLLLLVTLLTTDILGLIEDESFLGVL